MGESVSINSSDGNNIRNHGGRLSVHTFFSPVDATLGAFRPYGRVCRLDLTWAIFINIFLVVFSVPLSILISGRLFR